MPGIPEINQQILTQDLEYTPFSALTEEQFIAVDVYLTKNTEEFYAMQDNNPRKYGRERRFSDVGPSGGGGGGSTGGGARRSSAPQLHDPIIDIGQGRKPINPPERQGVSYIFFRALNKTDKNRIDQNLGLLPTCHPCPEPPKDCCNKSARAHVWPTQAEKLVLSPFISLTTKQSIAAVNAAYYKQEKGDCGLYCAIKIPIEDLTRHGLLNNTLLHNLDDEAPRNNAIASQEALLKYRDIPREWIVGIFESTINPGGPFAHTIKGIRFNAIVDRYIPEYELQRLRALERKEKFASKIVQKIVQKTKHSSDQILAKLKSATGRKDETLTEFIQHMRDNVGLGQNQEDVEDAISVVSSDDQQDIDFNTKVEADKYRKSLKHIWLLSKSYDPVSKTFPKMYNGRGQYSKKDTQEDGPFFKRMRDKKKQEHDPESLISYIIHKWEHDQKQVATVPAAAASAALAVQSEALPLDNKFQIKSNVLHQKPSSSSSLFTGSILNKDFLIGRTKPDIIEQLKSKGIAHDPKDTKDRLVELLIQSARYGPQQKYVGLGDAGAIAKKKSYSMFKEDTPSSGGGGGPASTSKPKEKSKAQLERQRIMAQNQQADRKLQQYMIQFSKQDQGLKIPSMRKAKEIQLIGKINLIKGIKPNFVKKLIKRIKEVFTEDDKRKRVLYRLLEKIKDGKDRFFYN